LVKKSAKKSSFLVFRYEKAQKKAKKISLYHEVHEGTRSFNKN
jgi:hypothetical protein